MRVEQPIGERGSLKWIQRAVAERWPSLESPILQFTGGKGLDWLSPVEQDKYAEYRDDSFLELIGSSHLQPDLAAFWPRRGPQWDAVGRVDENKVLLIEAKAHIREFCTPGTGASAASRAQIEAALHSVAEDIGATPKCSWAELFYQLANRLAHLWFLRRNGVDAYLVLVGFTGDKEMQGPETAEAWHAAYEVAAYTLGLPKRHKLARFIIHVNPQVPCD